MKIKKAKTVLSLCPNCGAKLNGWGSAHGWTPAPGDGTFCVYCRGLLIFDTDMRPRLPTDAERAAFMAHPDIRRQYLDLCLAETKGAFPIGNPDIDKPQ